MFVLIVLPTTFHKIPHNSVVNHVCLKYIHICMHYNTHDDPSFHVKFHTSIKISFYGCDLENETLGTKLKYLCKHALGGANMKVSLTCCWKIRIYSPTYHYNGCNISVTRPNRPIRFLLGAFPLIYNVSKKIQKTPNYQLV